MSIANTVGSYLDSHHVEYELMSHPVSYSSHATANASHIREDHIAKAVVLKDDKGYAMVVIPGSDWVKLHALQKELGRDFHLAEEFELKGLFKDCEIGAIPPIGQAYGLETYLDERLNSLANVYFEAGDHQHLVHVEGEGFHELFRGIRHGHFCHSS